MCSLFQIPGFHGIATGALLFCVVWAIAYLSLTKGPFNMDFPGEAGSFLKLLGIYIDIAKVVVGFASATIAALTCSVALIGGLRLRLEPVSGVLLDSNPHQLAAGSHSGLMKELLNHGFHRAF
jgi:hypothetical protein